MFTLTADQQLFVATTIEFLDVHHPCSRARQRNADAETPDARFWQQGAELGWTSLLVSEADGGGSISGDGLLELAALAAVFGSHAAPGPLIGTNVVAAALARWGSPEQRTGPLKELIAGSATAAWCAAVTIDPWTDRGAQVTAATFDDGVTLNGSVSCVEEAGNAKYILVNALEHQRDSYHLIATSSPGVAMTPLDGLDLTRRYWQVSLSDVSVPASARVGAVGTAALGNASLTDIVATLHAAEIVGATKRAVDTTLAWVQDRYSFGRPLAAYQEIKHRMADMRTAVQACAAVSERAARAVGRETGDRSAMASAAMAFVGTHGPEVVQDCIQLHGGIGVTADHDLHVLLRRAVVAANAFATPADFTQRLVGLIDAAEHGDRQR